MYHENKTHAFSEDAIRAELYAHIGSKVKLHLYTLTDSTNQRAKEFASAAPDSEREYIHVFIAAEQAKGRGRLGRSFLSRGGCGLYMSILSYPSVSAADGVLVTAYTAVVLCRVLSRLTPLSPRIKWVNDIYSGGKKLSGILTEGSIDTASGDLRYSVTGIGINVTRQDFGELRNIATDIESECGIRLSLHTLASEIINEFISGLDKLADAELAREYRERSMLIGAQVTVIKPLESYSATVVNITDRFELQLLRADGAPELLSTGEVSLKLKADA